MHTQLHCTRGHTTICVYMYILHEQTSSEKIMPMCAQYMRHCTHKIRTEQQEEKNGIHTRNEIKNEKLFHLFAGMAIITERRVTNSTLYIRFRYIFIIRYSYFYIAQYIPCYTFNHILLFI